jgi:uncharacterized membrane protein (GlpM family)
VLSPLVEIILPFLFAFLVVILITILAERYGTKTGGIAGTLPSTIIIAFLFIAINRGIPFTTHAITVAIAIMAMNLLFLTAFALLIPHSLPAALLGSFIIWAIGTVIIYFSNLDSMLVSQVIFILAYIACLWLLEKHKKIPSQHKIHMTYSARKLLLRGLLAGIVIASAVALSNINAAISGILAMFPAIFLSTMLIAYLEHGPDFTRALAKAMIYGSLSVTTYGIAIYLLYPATGIIIGTIGATLASLAVSLILYLLRPILI